jgi:hypothetical protein
MTPGNGVRCENYATERRRKKVTMATVLILNGVAVVSLLALLAATMRLPYHLPTSPGSGAERRHRYRRRQTLTASEGSRRGRGAPEPAYSE